MSNLRDNEDGTCNCRPFGEGCFFTDTLGEGPCDCECHKPMTTEETKYPYEGLHPDPITVSTDTLNNAMTNDGQGYYCCACEYDIEVLEGRLLAAKAKTQITLLNELIEEVEKIPETLQMNVYIETTRQNPELIKRDDVTTLLKSHLPK